MASSPMKKAHWIINTTIGKTLQPLKYGIQCYLLLQDAMMLFSS